MCANVLLFSKIFMFTFLFSLKQKNEVTYEQPVNIVISCKDSCARTKA